MDSQKSFFILYGYLEPKYLLMSKVVTLYPSDEAIIEGIILYDEEAETVLYLRHKDYCLRNMSFQYSDKEATKDIYHDAIIVFIEKVRKEGNFLVNTSIRTFLSSICRNQILIRYRVNSKVTIKDEQEENEVIQYTDWLNSVEGLNEERIVIIKEELEKMNVAGQKCFELLKGFYFENKTMEQLAVIHNYTSADNAKSQKWKCQERLKAQVKRRFNNG